MTACSYGGPTFNEHVIVRTFIGKLDDFFFVLSHTNLKRKLTITGIVIELTDVQLHHCTLGNFDLLYVVACALACCECPFGRSSSQSALPLFLPSVLVVVASFRLPVPACLVLPSISPSNNTTQHDVNNNDHDNDVVVTSLRRCVVASLRRCVVASLRCCVIASLRRCVGVLVLACFAASQQQRRSAAAQHSN